MIVGLSDLFNYSLDGYWSYGIYVLFIVLVRALIQFVI